MNRIPKDKTQKTNKEVNFHTNFPGVNNIMIPMIRRYIQEIPWDRTEENLRMES